MENLNDIKQGTRLEFAAASPGIVSAIWREVGNGKGDVIEARYCIAHDDGHESYHTFRRDGRSHHNQTHDITNVVHDYFDTLTS
jgi:hypothetical protein